MSQAYVIDPPSGWMYGFPKVISVEKYNDPNFDLSEWLVENGYPRDQFDSNGKPYWIKSWIQEFDDELTNPQGSTMIKGEMIDTIKLITFIKESNRIEGIFRDPTQDDIDQFQQFLDLPVVEVHHLEKFVSVYQPNAVLRRQVGLDVRVGSHIAPRGGPDIEVRLTSLLLDIEAGLPPWDAHVRFENIHPFTDGNGRSGRALWAWQMLELGHNPFRLGFLHTFYYQTLDSIQQ